MRILVTGAPRFLDDMPEADFAALDLKQRMKISGGNTGNFFIGSALQRHLDTVYPDANFTYIRGSQLMLMDPSITDDYDAIFMAGANFIGPKVDQGKLAKFIDATKLPFAIVGAGAQAADDSHTDLPVPAGTVRLLKIASERSKAVCVRGAFTKAVLERNGIEKVEVTGCPSLYFEADPAFLEGLMATDFGDQPASVFLPKRDRNLYKSDSDLKRLHQRLLPEIMAANSEYVVQTEMAEASVAAGIGDLAEKHKNVATYYDVGVLQQGKTHKWFTEHSHVFFRFNDWRGLFQEKGTRFCYATRFHGGLMAVMAGIPTIFITHDTRTKELCETGHLPYIDVPSLEGEKDLLGTLRSHAHYTSFASTYMNRRKKFLELLASLI